jgi:hypothetical protein
LTGVAFEPVSLLWLGTLHSHGWISKHKACGQTFVLESISKISWFAGSPAPPNKSVNPKNRFTFVV